MSIMNEIKVALDATKLPWKEDGWAPLQPPQDSAYMVVKDRQSIDSDDVHSLFVVEHNYTVYLYDYGDASVRIGTRDALMAACNNVSSMECTGYSKETKLYETVFTVNGLIEKVRVV